MDGFPDGVRHFDLNLVDLEIRGERFVDVGIVHVNWVEICFHFEQVERHHLAPEDLSSFVFEEPASILLFAVKQLVHLVFFALDFVRNLAALLKLDFLSCLSSHVD